ncbi:MAG: hypothetical protein ACREQJ_13005 [Candidatus Binatia bacterium]
MLAATLAVGGAYWAGCGDDDGDGGAVFFGDVSSVSGSSAAVRESRPSLVASLWSFGVRPAWAQSTCAAPSGGNLLFCVESVCTIVEGDCEFSESVGIEGGGPITATLRFVDDGDEDGQADSSEADSVVTQSLTFCSGDQVLIDNAAINFLSGITTASVSKVVNACDGGTNPTATQGAGGTPTPTRTPGGPTNTPGTPGTPSPSATPTYSYGAMMNEAPGQTLVFLASIGVIGLLIPRRRRRSR